MTRKLAGFMSHILLNGTAAEGGGTATSPPPPPAKAEADPSAGFTAALKAAGDNALGFAREMWGKAEGYRTEAEQARGKLPKDGAVVLEGDDVAAWNGFRGLGRKPEEVKADLERLPGLENTLKGHERARLIGDAARANGHDGKPLGFDAEVLATLAGPDLRIEVVDRKVGGKDVKVAEVVATSRNDKGAEVETRTPLDKHAAAHWAKFLPSLSIPAGGRQGAGHAPAPRPVPIPETRDGQPRPFRSLPRV